MKIIGRAPAKINLTLEIVNRRVSGYHTLRTVVLKLDKIFDEVAIEIEPNGSGIKVDSDSRLVPKNEKNTCHKAAQKFLEATEQKVGLQIFLKKKIPMAAGLGGGSSDAATTLMLLNDYFKQPLSQMKLEKIATEAGMDVPLFLVRENITFLKNLGNEIVFKGQWKNPSHFLLINPGIEVSTPWAYKNLAGSLWFMKKKRADVSAGLIKKLKQVLLEGWESFLYNDFELLMEDEYPIVRELKQALRALGARGALMSGSGATVFGVFDSLARARQAEKIIKRQYPKFVFLIG